MKPDRRFIVNKDIPLQNGGKIPKGITIYRNHECYYDLKGLLPKEYQEDFDRLVEFESKFGWKYLVPEKDNVGKSIINK